MKYYFNFGKLNMFNHMANNNYCFDNNHHHIKKNKFTIINCNQDMNHLSNNSSMISTMNLCMYNMMDHIKDNYIKYYNTLKNKFLNKFQDLNCNTDTYQYLNKSNMNYYYNFDKSSMINHIANNYYCFHNNAHHITKNKFTIFDCNQDMNHL